MTGAALLPLPLVVPVARLRVVARLWQRLLRFLANVKLGDEMLSVVTGAYVLRAHPAASFVRLRRVERETIEVHGNEQRRS